MRRQRFEVDGLEHGFGRSRRACVTIEGDGRENCWVMRVRPFRSTEEAVVRLVDVAEIVLERDAKARAAERSTTRRKR